MSLKPKLLIVESDRFSAAAVSSLSSVFDVDLQDLSREQLVKAVTDVDVLWVRLRHMIDSEIMAAAPRLKAIVTNTTGLNHIALAEASDRGISVLSLKGEVAFLDRVRATAEHTIALTLALLRRIPAAHLHACSGNWDRDLFQGREIHEKTVGVIGYGRLGRIVAGYFHAFGARVVVNSRELPEDGTVDSFECMSLDQLLDESDIVTLHVNYEPGNDSMIAADEFRRMKESAVFVNTARGELVDEDALRDALESCSISGAAVDVVRDEQLQQGASSALTRLAQDTNRLVLTPHIAGNTVESLEKTEIFLAEKLCARIADIKGQCTPSV